MLAIDLFCGLGGWAEGFLSEGYKVIGFDIERHDYGSGAYPGTSMHRLFMSAPKGMELDHINRNGCDNRHVNLRLATRSQQVTNTKHRRKYRGIYCMPSGMFGARGTTIGDRRRLGTFSTAEQAAKAWDQWARANYGEFAVLNFPEVNG